MCNQPPPVALCGRKRSLASEENNGKRPRPLPACRAGAQVSWRSPEDLFTCRASGRGLGGVPLLLSSRSQDSLTCLTSRQGSKPRAIPPAAAGQHLPDRRPPVRVRNPAHRADLHPHPARPPLRGLFPAEHRPAALACLLQSLAAAKRENGSSAGPDISPFANVTGTLGQFEVAGRAKDGRVCLGPTGCNSVRPLPNLLSASIVERTPAHLTANDGPNSLTLAA